MSLDDAKHVQRSVTVRRSDWVPYPYKWTNGCMVTQPANAISKVPVCAWADGKTAEKVKIPLNFFPWEPACRRLLLPLLRPTGLFNQWKERKYWTVPFERMSAQSHFSAGRKFDRHSRLRHRVNACCEKEGYSRSLQPKLISPGFLLYVIWQYFYTR